VVSSFCRTCGGHFRVRKGIALAHPGLRVSGLAEAGEPRARRPVAPASPAEPPAPLGDSWLVSAEAQNEGARPLLPPPGEAEEPETGISAGAFFGLVDESQEGGTGDSPALGREAQGRDALARGSIAALIGAQQTVVIAEKERMPPNYVEPSPRRRREDGVPSLPVRCYRCYHVQEVSRYAKSSQCERCSTYISLANYEIKTVQSHALRTRGDVTITKRGGLVDGSEIACHHLVVNGTLDATVDCTGDAVFRHSGTARGRLHCDKLVVEKDCEVRFPDGVMARRAEIAGRLVGDLTCSGKVRIARGGLLEGDLAAVELELKEGGHVSGETKLDPATSTVLPLRQGFNPSVIG